MKIAKLDYQLPKKRIAQKPAHPRDCSKLLAISTETGELNHQIFHEISDYLDQNDVLVFNQTKVFPARFFGKKASGGKIEILLLKRIKDGIWEVLTKPGLEIGKLIYFKDFEAEVIKRNGEVATLEFDVSDEWLMQNLEKNGFTPLPPYIKSTESERKLRKEYQTIYAKNLGSSAAPTAGLHFTERLMHKLTKKGVTFEYVTLHVGMGTFAPIKADLIEKHQIHSEYFEIDGRTAKRLNQAKKEGKRIVAVGTTTTRVLESALRYNKIVAKKGETSLFIYPPFKFKFVDAMITNFHLPKSSLLALVSAFVSWPNTKRRFSSFEKSVVGAGYKEAIKRKYRFYSFGDANLLY
jgi:S-adenosylmethionine:tRNA ribosyltransferase-isomerase